MVRSDLFACLGKIGLLRMERGYPFRAESVIGVLRRLSGSERSDDHMNANILKRVVRAIADGSQSDLDRLADKIVEAERRTGHKKLADQLEAILKQPRPRGNGHAPQ